jgi:hypothetical protein
MNRHVSALLMLVILGALAVSQGCIKRMKMPSEELMWQPAPDRFERGAERFEEVGRLTAINGSPDFMIFDVIESLDGQVIAASAQVWSEVRGNENSGRGVRISARGVVIWSIADNEREWATIPAPYPEYDGSWSEPLCFSADNVLLAVERDERVSIWSRREQRILSTFRVSDEEKVRFAEGDGVFIVRTAWIDTSGFSADGSVFEATILTNDSARVMSWSSQTGERISQLYVNRPMVADWRSNLPLSYEGVGSGDFVSSFHYDAVRSLNNRYLALAFAGKSDYLFKVEDTPGHMRVWDTGTQKLVSWSGLADEPHRWHSPRPFVFLSRPFGLLYADRAGVHIVDVEARKILATVPHEDDYTSITDMHWLPTARLLAVEYRESLKLLRVRE